VWVWVWMCVFVCVCRVHVHIYIYIYMYIYIYAYIHLCVYAYKEMRTATHYLARMTLQKAKQEPFLRKILGGILHSGEDAQNSLSLHVIAAKEPYNSWLFCGKRPAIVRAASGGTLAPEPPRATGVRPEPPRIAGHSHSHPFLPLFPRDQTSQTCDLNRTSCPRHCFSKKLEIGRPQPGSPFLHLRSDVSLTKTTDFKSDIFCTFFEMGRLLILKSDFDRTSMSDLKMRRRAI